MARGRTVFVLNALVVTALTVAVLVFVNLLSIDHFQRVDLTEKNVYTLDPLSRDIAGRFQDAVTVRYYVTEDRFPPEPAFESLRQLVVDKLEEYAAASNNKMVVNVIDPRETRKDISSETKEKLEAEGVVVSSHTVRPEGTPITVEFYSSIKINYLDKTRVVNDVTDIANLEYQFTRALRELQVFEIPEVGFYFSGEEKGFGRDGQFRNLQDVLRKDYSLRTVDLGEDDPVPADLDVLFVVAPDGVPERHEYEIDQFIMRGGKAVFLLDVFDPRKAQRQWMRGPAIFMKVESGIEDMLRHYGVRYSGEKPNVLLDIDECIYREVPRQIMVDGIPVVKRERKKIPYVILTKKANYNPDLAFVNELDKIGFIFAVAIEPTEAVEKDGGAVRFLPVVRSSRKSWRIDFAGPVIVESKIEDQTDEPEKNLLKHNPEGRQYLLAAVLEGVFESFYKGKDVPSPVKAEDDKKPPRPEEKKKPRPAPETVETSPENRIVVIGDAGLFSDLALPYHQPNVAFLENLLEWLTTEETLSQIRAKSYDTRPLEDLRAWQRELWTALLVGVPPVLVLLVGLGVYILRHFEKSVFLRALAETPAGGAAGPPDGPKEPGAGEAPPAAPWTGGPAPPAGGGEAPGGPEGGSGPEAGKTTEGPESPEEGA